MNSKNPSQNARKSAARLVAAQLLYEHMMTETTLSALIEDYRYTRIKNPIDDEGEEALVQADFNMLREILETVEEHSAMLSKSIDSALKNKKKTPEKLILSILKCGAAELFTSVDKGIDAALIINDYIEVTRAFFNEGEVKLVHATLDGIFKSFQ